MHLYSASVPKNLCYIAVVFIFTCTNSYGPVLKSFANSNLCDFCFCCSAMKLISLMTKFFS